MTDNFRQDLGDKAEATLKPDSQKSTLEYASDQVKGTADSVAGTLQPDSEKSFGQKATDTFSSGTSDTQNQSSDLMSQAQEAGTNLYNSASDTVSSGIKQGQDALGYGENN